MEPPLQPRDVVTSESVDRPEGLAERIAVALDRLARATRLQRQDLATRYGLSPLQVDLLTVLADGQPPEPLVGLLATEVGVTQPTVTDSLRALQRKGLVERRRDLGDRRRARVGLTPAGRRFVDEVVVVAQDDLVDAVADLPRSVQEATLETLLTLIAGLVDTGAITVARTCLTCHYHRQDAGTHRCVLLGIDLPPGHLRVNCPEHVPA